MNANPERMEPQVNASKRNRKSAESAESADKNSEDGTTGECHPEDMNSMGRFLTPEMGPKLRQIRLRVGIAHH
jgi:hypothetical protein